MSALCVTWMLPVVLLGQAAPPPGEAAPSRPRSLLVLPLEARAGVSAAVANALTQSLAAEARRIPGRTVVTRADVEQMLSVEQQKQLVGCGETSCVLEIAGALSAEEVLYGTVGQLGDGELVVSLNVVDPKAGAARAGVLERTARDPDAMLDCVPRGLARLFPGYQPPPSRVAPVHAALLLPLAWSAGAAFYYATISALPATLTYAATLFFCPPAIPCWLCFVPCGLLGCLLSPLPGAGLLSYLLDAVGRRQVGVRHAAWAGMLTLVGVGGAGLLLGLLVGSVAGVLVFTGVLDARNLANGAFASSSRELTSIALGVATTSAVAMTAGLLSVFVVPAVQLAVLWAQATVRPPDSAAAIPALYAPSEKTPAALQWLPRGLVGGQVDALEKPEQ